MSDPTPEQPLTRVVALIDGSHTAVRAAKKAAQVAKGLGLPLELITVAQPQADSARTDVAFFESTLPGAQSEEQKLARERQAPLTAAAAELPADVALTFTVLEGRPKEVLFAALDARPGALVFMGRTGLNAIQRVLKGSVATALATYSSRPVVIVP